MNGDGSVRQLWLNATFLFAASLQLAACSSPIEPLYVATPPPTVEGVVGPDSKAAAGAVSLGIINAFASMESVYQLGSSDIGALAGAPPARLARATGAGEVLLAAIRGEEVKLARHAPDGTCLWTTAFMAPGGDVAAMVSQVFYRVSSAYANRPQRRGFQAPAASLEDYRAFLALWDRVRSHESLHLPQALEQLAAIRNSSPALIDASLLEVSVASYLYRTGRNATVLRQAREALDAAREVAPHHPRTALAAADLALAIGDLKATAAAVDELIETEPFHPSACRYQARLAELENDVDRALAALKEECNPRVSVWNLRALADLEMRNGLIDEARTHLGKALELAPDYVAVKVKLGELELRSGDPARAQQLFLEVTRQAPQPYYLTNLGTADLLLGNFREAVISYRQAVELGSAAPVVLMNLADALLLDGEESEALELYQRAAEVQATTPEDIAARAYCRARCGMVAEAVTEVESALEKAPQSADVAYYSAVVFLIAGQPDRACALMGEAMNLGMNRIWFSLPWFDGYSHCV